MPNHIEISISIPDICREKFYNYVVSISSMRPDWWDPDTLSLQVDFHKIIPSSDGDDWYEAHCADWGTKWNAMLSQFHWDNNVGHIYFETAWNTPDPILHKICKPNWEVLYKDEINDDEPIRWNTLS